VTSCASAFNYGRLCGVLQLDDTELENMRGTKAALTALINRVSKVRQELEVIWI
jgi:hypothetical protein